MPVEISFLGGLLAGLASSLHCAGMCGGIAASLMMTLSPDEQTHSRAATLLTAQAGRVTAYVAAGALLGLAGTGFYTLFDLDFAHQMFRWVAAAILIWIGLSLTGLLPPLSFLDRFLAPLTRRVLRPARSGRFAGTFAAGLIWGLLPCAMVYAVLLYAMLSGTAGGGAMVMLGFGLGTLPAVTASAFGFGLLERAGRQASLRVVAGVDIAVLGAITLVFSPEQIAAICGF
ncbi:sulfite exporter TauE/SafE family protein [Hyphobacterium marinum]|uniref:Sulfite exporter TauE/SafE family protein n=1 Tax=Hyphobacterium marinum TaxID=3116574 RepID=A0ABU7LU32_9PROT|nr:sulfite exporter TauE/SafE family protein [Hyphobacterium sp. Y6023]MEE2565069.1 sulfite exporter TauE/SafE family protein [Hyphobacterium sp. Y6023]